MPGAFDQLKALATLNLLSNPLNCNCHMKWLSNWLKNHNIVTGNPRCQTPVDLRDIPIEDIEPKDFECSEVERDYADCGPDSQCPSRCICTGSVVRCSRQKLKAVPRYVQPITTELYLDVNDISTIPHELNQLRDLTRLDLSNNQIAILEDNIFGNLSELQTLILSYNKLQCIQKDAFRGLKKLRVLSLHGNDISMIPEGSFVDLISISHIAMGANPLFCDCNLRWLAEWIQKDFVEGGIARCHEPRPMRDKLIMSAPPNHFICTEDTDPSILAKCDSCYSFPCANGATCRSRPLRDYQCECAPGFHGLHCEYKIDACFGNPCDNAGTCKVMEAGRFSYDGDRCETNIDDCKANKCENNSTCIDQIESYRCHCLPGFGGEYCETKIQFCHKEYNPCKNGAQCVDHKTHYQCLCGKGFSGYNCTDNVDDCADNLCQNGATCMDGVNSYRCECPVGFAGKFCELAPMVELYPQTSPCQQHDCKHGVCFMPSGSSDYICKCSAGYTGKRCEMMSSISFREGSYLELDPLKTIPDVNLTLKFVTRKESGVVLYWGESQHLAVELFKGRIRISLDVGNYPVSTMFSYEMVSDGRYHQIEFLLVKKNITMRVDGGQQRTIVNEGSKEYLECKSSLYIGGMPEKVANNALKNWQIWNSSSLEGCMREILMNGNPPDLNGARRQHLVQPGCVEFDDINKPCLNHLCQNGKCVPTSDQQTYECKCRSGWNGPFCDQAPTCQKEMKRDFYYSDTCRSTKKLKLSQCVGSCGDNCCKALKSKRRSVRMACTDGSKFTKEIEMVRKCGCSGKC
ncbi:unnamed protein product [Medioppia subpectinata]|uniref:Protein slit n=1 Tax=Medioppia subpectinata TaxID=1979941 RepID=A0A7R9L3Q6_9ACAR|nr:unnamed protein product [Medioppia subpectinata]CAG2114694.1 unnamed protein product [Medioppia subpectinata]